tara:strand:+ start:1771 stop:2040 length:270 start_codon:yes stop_codon:yes gene_type:complete
MSYEDEKRQVLNRYTPVEESGRWVPKCADCGEEDLDVLTLHHLLGHGGQDRKEYGWGIKFFKSLRERGFPDEFQVLCLNCHRKRTKLKK